MVRREELTDEQWAILEPLIPATVRRADGRGRPQLHSDPASVSRTAGYAAFSMFSTSTGVR
jgi:hypothetical protein